MIDEGFDAVRVASERAREGEGESARRKRYAAPALTDFGPLHRITQAGAAASTNDAFGTGMNMTKYTMIG